MKFNTNYSILVLYNDNKIFIQDRKSISKRWEEWWFFWGRLEKWENFEEALIRETKEELNIDISWDYKYIWTTIFNLEWFWIQEVKIYLVKYKLSYNNTLIVKEWDWWKFVTLDEFKNLKITPWTYIWIEILEEYFKNNI